MAYASPPPPWKPAPPSRRPPPPPPPLPRRPLPHHDTTLTLSLSRPPSGPSYCALAATPPHARSSSAQRLPADGAAVRARSSPAGDAPPPPPPPCTECDKQFPSWKALFGHMRCHPERQWRGVTRFTPPPQHLRHGGGGAPAPAPAAAGQFTVQEREVAASLLMLSGVPPAAAKGKKRPLGSPSRSKETCGTSTYPSPAPAPARCDGGHKCTVCDRGFATGQALGGHKRCHWERAASEVVVVVADAGGCSESATSETAPTATAAALDLNLPPPGPPLPQKNNNQGGSVSALLDLKLWY
ncbi:hypothetical protein ACP4OV_015996 [Aristida adscensionis]